MKKTLIIFTLILIVILPACEKASPLDEYLSACETLKKSKSLSIVAIYNVKSDYDDRDDEQITFSSAVQYNRLDDSKSVDFNLNNIEIKAYTTIGAEGNTMGFPFYQKERILYLKPFAYGDMYYMDMASDEYKSLPASTIFLLPADILATPYTSDDIAVSERTMSLSGNQYDLTCYTIPLEKRNLQEMFAFYDLVIETSKRDIDDFTTSILSSDISYKVYIDKKGNIKYMEVLFVASLPDPENPRVKFPMTVSATIEVLSRNKNDFEFPDTSEAKDYFSLPIF